MQDVLFWLITIPTMTLIAVLVLLREQLFDSRFMLWLRGLAGFFSELLVVYDLWPCWFLEELLQELEEQQRQRQRLTYTPLLLDEPIMAKEEEPECTKVF